MWSHICVEHIQVRQHMYPFPFQSSESLLNVVHFLFEHFHMRFDHSFVTYDHSQILVLFHQFNVPYFSWCYGLSPSLLLNLHQFGLLLIDVHSNLMTLLIQILQKFSYLTSLHDDHYIISICHDILVPQSLF